MKFLSSDGKRLFKFSGYGRFGTTVAERARVLAETGFGPAFLGDQDGFAEYEMLHGRPACKRDLSRELLERIAAYCAMRASEFRVAVRDEPSLTAMARFNHEQLTGEAAPDWLHLEGGSTAVLCDGRMQPHEWVVEDGRAARKTDGETHGDDHFFPGPCDIAWDLAGAIIEWQMPDDAAEALLGRYAALTGDSAHKRIAAYVPAYAAFRAAYCRMAAFALRGTSEHERLREAAAEYERGLRSASHSGIPTLSTSL